MKGLLSQNVFKPHYNKNWNKSKAQLQTPVPKPQLAHCVFKKENRSSFHDHMQCMITPRMCLQQADEEVVHLDIKNNLHSINFLYKWVCCSEQR